MKEYEEIHYNITYDATIEEVANKLIEIIYSIKQAIDLKKEQTIIINIKQ